MGIDSLLGSFNGAVVAHEGVFGHVLDVGVPEDDVGDGGGLDFLDDFSGIGLFVPEPVAVADAPELQCGHSCSELAVHGLLQLPLTQHAHVGIDVVHAVVALLDDEPVELVLEDLLEGLQPLEAVGHPQGVVVAHAVVPVAVGVPGEEVEVFAHDFHGHVPELVDVVEGALLGEGEGESLEDVVGAEVGERLGVADEQVEQVDLLDCAAVAVDRLVGVRDVGVADPVGGRGELGGDGGVCALVVALVAADVAVEVLPPEEARQVVLHPDLLHQPDHVVPRSVEDLLVGERLVGRNDEVAQPVVLAEEEHLQRGEPHVFVGPHVARVELPVLVDGQQVARRGLQLPLRVGPEPVVDCGSRAVDHARVDPGGDLVDVGPGSLGGVVLGAEVGDGLVAAAVGVEVVVAAGHWNVNLFGGALCAEGDVVVEELSPGAEEHGEVELVGDDDVAVELGDGLAEEARVGQVAQRFAPAVLVAGRRLPIQVGHGLAPVGLLEVVATAIDAPDDVLQLEQPGNVHLPPWLVHLDLHALQQHQLRQHQHHLPNHLNYKSIRHCHHSKDRYGSLQLSRQQQQYKLLLKMEVLSSARACLNKENQSSDHHKQLQRLRVQLNDRTFQLHKLSEDHAQEKARVYLQLQKEKQLHAKALKQLRDRIREDNDGWLATVDHLRRDNQEAIAQLTRDLQQQLQKEAQKAVQDSEDKCGREIRQLTLRLVQQEEAGRRREEELRSEARAEAELLLASARKAEQEKQRKHRAALLEIKAEYESNLSKLQEMFLKEESLRLQAQNDYQTAIKSHVREKIIWESVEAAMNQQIAQLQEQISQKGRQLSQLSELKRQVELSCKKELQQMKQECEGRLQGLREEHEARERDNCCRYSGQVQLLRAEMEKLVGIHRKKEECWLQSGRMVLELFEKRESKKEDVKAIQQLQVELIKKDFLIQRERKELKNCKLQLQNMEETYDRIFVFNSNLSRCKTKSYQIKKLKASGQLNHSNRSTILSDKAAERRYLIQKSE